MLNLECDKCKLEGKKCQKCETGWDLNDHSDVVITKMEKLRQALTIEELIEIAKNRNLQREMKTKIWPPPRTDIDENFIIYSKR